MPRLTPIVIALGLLTAACSAEPGPVAAAQDPSEAARDTVSGISVTGEGKVTGRPDTLTVDLGVSVLRDEASQAISEAASLADRMIQALRQAGVAEEDIQTANYTVSPEFDFSGERQEVIGYRVTNTLIAKVRDLERAGEVIDAATATAGDDVVVQGIRFDLADNRAMVEAARASAWENARAKAEQLAELAGVGLGAPISISESFSSVPPPIPFEARAEAAASATPIQPGQLEVTVTLQVRYAIAP